MGERRKVEGELKVAQEAVADLERTKKELEGNIQRKEKDASGLFSKLDDEQSLVAKVQKTIKEIQSRVEGMEEELEAERQGRAKAERQRSDLSRELENLNERLGEASGATAAQIELNKKREAEVTKIRRDLEETQIQQEATIVGLKRKHAAENADLLRQLQELENSANMLAKLKLNLADQLSEARAVADNEAKERQSLLGKFRNAEHDVAGMKDHFDEEVSAKENIGRQLSKAICEADMMRERYEKEGVAKAEELEMAKLKMQARLSEAESTADQLQAKLAQVEKAKSKISAEIESMAGQLDQAQILNSSMEKKAKQFDL